MSNIMVFNDISTVGNCSMAAVIPVLNAMGHNVFPVTTAVLSSQTAFESFYLDDRLDSLNFIGRELENLDFKIDAMLLGYLPSAIDIENLWAIVNRHLQKGAKLYVDPILGDNGEIYPTVDENLCAYMQELIGRADVIFPNLTEACLLSGTDYVDTIYHIADGDEEETVRAIGKKLLTDTSIEKLIITGIRKGDSVSNLYMDDTFGYKISRPYLKVGFSGTGDLFAAAVTGYLENGVDAKTAIEKTADFISACINDTPSYRDPRYGVDFAKHLKMLSE